MNLVKKTRSQQVSRRIRLEAYLVGGVGSLALATNVEAGIVVIDLKNAGSNGIDISGLNAGIPLGGSKNVASFFIPGGYSCSMRLENGSSNWFGIDGNDGLRFGTLGGYANPQPFSAGSTIGSSTSTIWSESNDQTLFQIQFGPLRYTAPAFGENKYMAMRTQIGSDFYYGWMKVTWDPTSKNFQILGAAYESTKNTAILAGDTGAAPVPEPASGAIAALLMGGTALRQWRKKRRDASNEAVAS